MLKPHHDYALCVRNSERVSWRLDDVMPPDASLDFSRPFLPEPLARTRALDGLDESQRLTMNHIMGKAYLNLFSFVEEYIIAMVTQHAHAELFGDNVALRALLRFADEEVKHQQLFHRYKAAFDRDFGATEVLDNAAEVAGVILSKSPMAVVLTTLHFEILTQHHYTSSVREDDALDPLFASLLKHHWMEEAQHAKIDILELERMVGTATEEDLRACFDDYLSICDALADLLDQQARLDVESLGVKTGKALGGARGELTSNVARAYRHMFLRRGMEHRELGAIVESISPGALARIRARSASL